MENKNVVYFKATENGNEIAVEAPVDKNISRVVVSELMSDWGAPMTRYGIDYHMAYLNSTEEDDCEIPPEIYFVGKQDDFFYFLRVVGYVSADDTKVDREQVMRLINAGKGEFKLYWWMANDALATDNPGINSVNGELIYNIELTDELTVEITVEGELEESFYLEAMEKFCDRVDMEDYSLRAF